MNEEEKPDENKSPQYKKYFKIESSDKKFKDVSCFDYDTINKYIESFFSKASVANDIHNHWRKFGLKKSLINHHR